MNRVQALSAAAIAAGVSFGVCDSAQAGVVITIEEVGTDVVASGGGSLDLSLWTHVATVMQPPGLQANNAIALGPLSQTVDIYVPPPSLSGPASIGPGTAMFFADSGGGDPVGLSWLSGLEAMFVPAAYSSGDPIVGSTATFANESFASLGISPGHYAWTWDSVAGGTDSFTVNIVVPAPGALVLFGVACVRSRRRRP